ncbi:MAG: hypothetical protein O7J95_09395 [Planctomycetota bacterium]|nr:hypothetical protein [Planctomycetota bacterium]
MPQHADRTDTVQEKLRLIEAALTAKRHDLALSLAESVKDTLTWLRQTAGDPPPLDIDAGSAGSVSDLPAVWARWARGWSRQQSVALFEGVGIARSREPVSIRVGFPESPAPPEPLVSDLRREVRVARVEDDGALREVVSQIHGERLDGDVRTATLVFPADVPAHGSARYVIFFANPFAELPEYTTDLRVSGEGYGLDVSNEHYTARLSRQMGQLERLTSKRQHGLELYAGNSANGLAKKMT